ncbi:hypothetical protein [Geopsychrobacter electrodiphilus]|uniref:hypothetical protein n=1 Tax=Geopsychrobacter electrodiphilus TaxID=225196 RepID=UPI0003A48731|nr:hypothetical protein [Geopsychrobacter electrodiphilus]
MKCVRFNWNLSHLLLWFCLLLLCGCGVPLVWQHPEGLSQAELQQATDECLRLSRQEAENSDYFSPHFYPRFPFYDRHYYRHSAYWYGEPPPFYYDVQRRWYDEQRYFHICMLAKGWRQVPAIPPR